MTKIQGTGLAILGFIGGMLASHFLGMILLVFNFYGWCAGHLIALAILIGFGIKNKKKPHLMVFFSSGTLGYVLYTVALTFLMLAVGSALAEVTPLP